MTKYLAGKANKKGFTLVELILVLMILGIVAAIGSDFLLTVTRSYNLTEKRFKLISKGRLAIEQMTRQLRVALPNGLRVSASGSCIEFLPIVAGANYLDYLPDAENGAPAVSTINTSSFTLAAGTAAYVAISPLFASEVYTTAVPSSLASIDSIATTPVSSIALLAPHQFYRNSSNRRLFITDQPKRFCLSSEGLVEYSDYGLLTSALNDINPGGNSNLMALNVAASGQAFSLSAASENRNAAVNISLLFSDRGEQVNLRNTVLVRNVP